MDEGERERFARGDSWSYSCFFFGLFSCWVRVTMIVTLFGSSDTVEHAQLLMGNIHICSTGLYGIGGRERLIQAS